MPSSRTETDAMSASTPRILVSDKLPPDGVALLRGAGFTVDVDVGLSADALSAIIDRYDGLVVRSATRVTADLLERADRLKVVGRAGVGVDNIDLDAATRRGVVVMNAPGGSSTAVAEHTFAMILAAVRHIAPASASLRTGRWDKKRYGGRELAGQTLGVVGLGRIGAMVAQRALAFGMKVVAYDPFVTEEAARELRVELVSLDDLWPAVDVVSLHVPLTDETHHLVGDTTIARMKPGAIVVNCARGGIVDEDALVRALRSGHLAGAAIDTFEQEPPSPDNPLLGLDTVVCTPHLGASTGEAQRAVAVQLANQLVSFFDEGEIRYGVNVASVSRELLEALGPWLQLASRVGELAALLVPARPTSVRVDFAGEVARRPTGALTSRVLRGLLARVSELPVNVVNARAVARERGLDVEERLREDSSDYTSTVGVYLETAEQSVEVVGTVFGRRDLRIVRIDSYELDAIPEGHLLIVRNDDVPGMVGEIGSAIGDAGINIGRIHLSRSALRGRALSVINIDSPAPPDVVERLRALPQVVGVRQILL